MPPCPIMSSNEPAPKYTETDPEWVELMAQDRSERANTPMLARSGREVLVEQSHYGKLYSDVELPVWQRVAFLAYARADTSGHVPFNGNRIAEILDRPVRRVTEAIAKAVERGWLQDGSSRHCLVIPTPMRSRYHAGDEAYCSHWRG
ncbi:hypothetical protein AXK59_16755 [Tsukamurella tyrosinosolvens]|nr:hypothetical protein AXK59_16755 [Tsukamurella tyrosinosolvens]